MQTSQFHIKTAFTLIELLVVIAIISILAAILFPVFAKARENARRTSCLSNVRQIGMGFQQYFQDYDEQFPFVKGDSPWIYTMQPYLKSTQILRCPSDTASTWVPDASYYDATVTGVRRTSYTLNGYFPPGNSNPGQGGNFSSIVSVQKPASVIFVSESASTFTGNYFHAHVWNYPLSTGHWNTTTDRPDDLAYERHLGGFNAAFLDGHAKWQRWEQAWANRDPSVAGQSVTYVNSSGATVTGVTPPMKGMFDPRQY